ncbi:trypco2 family protein [Streptomyces nanhaiensis]|uniref:trypco2 family protein n=1 Tax=Streptomyces nanhaiensis TaxID=679319 RepID=UPI00399CE2A6
MGSGNGHGEQGLDLADAITLLRDQIAEAQARIAGLDGTDAGHKGVLFGLGDITLELGMELTRTRGADGGLRFSVVTFGARRERADRTTHTVTVQLKPHRPDGGDVLVGAWE